MGTRTSPLRGGIFRIILKDAIPESQDLPSLIEGISTPTKSGSERPEYFIHKTLLSSLSAEFDKHVNNDMKEGRENSIELSEVDEPTLEAFLEWAYFKDYQHATLLPKSSAALLYHTKIYVLADRFNIPLLEDLAFSKITTLLAELGMIPEHEDHIAVIAATAYAYDNLLAHSGSPSDSGPTLERLLRYYTEYIFWALDVFRSNDEFIKLLASNSDFLAAFVMSCRPALMPPWAAGTPTDSTHAFYRKCACNYIGVMGIQCRSCSKYDNEIGMNIGYHGSLPDTAGADRISGTKTNFEYTCKWCKATNIYDASKAHFYCQRSKGVVSVCELYKGYLWCPRCHEPGYSGNISIV